MKDRTYLQSQIERRTCDIVNGVVAIYKPMMFPVDKRYMYDGKTNISFATSIARSYAYYVMHDMFGFTYREIATRAHKSLSSVIKSTRIARQRIYVDTVFSEVHKQMSESITKGLL